MAEDNDLLTTVDSLTCSICLKTLHLTLGKIIYLWITIRYSIVSSIVSRLLESSMPNTHELSWNITMLLFAVRDLKVWRLREIDNCAEEPEMHVFVSNYSI